MEHALGILWKFLGETVHTILILLIGIAIGSAVMWYDVRTQCGAYQQHFVPWGDADGYECFYESPWNRRPAARTPKYDI